MDALLAFIKRYNFVFVFLLLEILAIIFITQNSNYQGSKIVRAGNAIAGRCYGTISAVGDYFGLRKENPRTTPSTSSATAILRPAW